MNNGSKTVVKESRISDIRSPENKTVEQKKQINSKTELREKSNKALVEITNESVSGNLPKGTPKAKEKEILNKKDNEDKGSNEVIQKFEANPLKKLNKNHSVHLNNTLNTSLNASIAVEHQDPNKMTDEKAYRILKKGGALDGYECISCYNTRRFI